MLLLPSYQRKMLVEMLSMRIEYIYLQIFFFLVFEPNLNARRELRRSRSLIGAEGALEVEAIFCNSMLP